MTTSEQTTVGEFVKKDYRTAAVFRAHHIDFCCGGKTTLQEACSKRGIDRTRLVSELESLMQAPGAQDNYDLWSLTFLVDYIVNNHHTFVRAKLPEIHFLAEKVARVHGLFHPELSRIHELFLQVEEELAHHMMKEETILFPYIKKLEEALLSRLPMDLGYFGTVKNPIRMMETEHENAGEAMAEIEELSNHFTPPADACTSYKVLFNFLNDFQADLHKHVHLENNVLFPKAIGMEERLLTAVR